MIRWKGLIFIGAVLGMSCVLMLIFKDSWLEKRIEQAGSSWVGAKVEIDNLDFSLTGLHLRWDRLQVTDPQHTMRNMIETGFTEWNMETWPLFAGKVIIDNLELSDLRTNTPRESDGALPTPVRRPAPKKPGLVANTVTRLSGQVSSNVTTNLTTFSRRVNVDSLMQLADLRSVDQIDSLRSALVLRYNQWEDRLTNLDYRQEVNQIESDLRSLSLRQLQSVEGIRDAITNMTETQKRVKQLAQNIRSTKDELVQDLTTMRDTLKVVDDWIAADYRRARAAAKIPDISAGNISKFIFGDQLVNQFTKYTGYVETARGYLARLKSDEQPAREKPPRLQGQDIPFPTRNARPRFWIKRIRLSGVTGDQLPLSGEILNIVSDQRVIGQPTTLQLQSTPESGTAMDITGTFDYRQDAPEESFQLVYAGFSLKNNNLFKSPLLPSEVSGGTGTVHSTLELKARSVNSTTRFDTDNIQFRMSDAQGQSQLAKIVQSMTAGIHSLNFIARITGDSSNVQFSLNSNLDDILQQNLQATVFREIERARTEIRNRVETQVEKYRTQLESVVSQQEAKLRAQIEEYDQNAADVLALAETKEADLRAELQDRLKNEGLDRLKELLK